MSNKYALIHFAGFGQLLPVAAALALVPDEC
jgi:hypothetical protein